MHLEYWRGEGTNPIAIFCHQIDAVQQLYGSRNFCYSMIKKLSMTYLAQFEEIGDQVKELFLITETCRQKVH